VLGKMSLATSPIAALMAPITKRPLFGDWIPARNFLSCTSVPDGRRRGREKAHQPGDLNEDKILRRSVTIGTMTALRPHDDG
jgi:hypothetical protein